MAENSASALAVDADFVEWFAQEVGIAAFSGSK